jgi:hypothetical protein
MVNRAGIRSVFYTLQSLDAPPNVDEFKFRMGYKAKPLRQRIIFHPQLRPFVNPVMHKILLRLLRRDPENPKLSKADGLIRAYLNGRRPLFEQEWPECLKDRKIELMAKQN